MTCIPHSINRLSQLSRVSLSHYTKTESRQICVRNRHLRQRCQLVTRYGSLRWSVTRCRPRALHAAIEGRRRVGPIVRRYADAPDTVASLHVLCRSLKQQTMRVPVHGGGSRQPLAGSSRGGGGEHAPRPSYTVRSSSCSCNVKTRTTVDPRAARMVKRSDGQACLAIPIHMAINSAGHFNSGTATVPNHNHQRTVNLAKH